MGLGDGYDQEFIENQFSEVLRALQARNDVTLPENLREPQGTDVANDLRAVTRTLNTLLDAIRLQTSAYTPLLTLGDGGLGSFLDGVRDEVCRQGNLQGGKGHIVQHTPDGVLIIDTDTRDDFVLPDETTMIQWVKLTTAVTTPESGVPYADGNPSSDKDGTTIDTTRTVRTYLPVVGGGTPYLTIGDVIPVQMDSNGAFISQQVGPSTPPAANVPIGGCIVWADIDTSGVPQNVPTGWALCDGENGTKDMRSAFIVGYDARPGSGYTDARTTGGSATVTFASHTVSAHSHGGTTSAGTAHTHTVASSGAHANSGTTDAGSSHAHSVSTIASDGNEYTVDSGSAQTINTNVHLHLASAGNEAAHTHTFTSGTDGAHTHSPANESAHTHTISEQALQTLTHTAQDNRPPWVVAVWIQRIS